jgi:hypothetical protein
LTPTSRAAATAIRDHADALDDLRLRLEAVRFASTLIDHGDPVKGSMPAWIRARMAPHVREQDRIVEYVAENFAIAAKRLRATAAALNRERNAPPLARVAVAAFWAPAGKGAPSVDFTAKPDITAQVQGLARSMAVGGWAAERLLAQPPAPGLALEGAPTGIVPLRKVEEALHVRPDVVAAQVRAWHDMSAELHRIAQELQDRLEHDMPSWTGEAHAAYCWLMDHNVNSTIALSGAAAGFAAAIEGVGVVTDAALGRSRTRTGALLACLGAWSRAGARSPSEVQMAVAMAQWAFAAGGDLAAVARSLRTLCVQLGRQAA